MAVVHDCQWAQFLFTTVCSICAPALTVREGRAILEWAVVAFALRTQAHDALSGCWWTLFLLDWLRGSLMIWMQMESRAEMYQYVGCGSPGPAYLDANVLWKVALTSLEYSSIFKSWMSFHPLQPTKQLIFLIYGGVGNEQGWLSCGCLVGIMQYVMTVSDSLWLSAICS